MIIFLCKILNEEYYYEQGPSLFTGEPITFSIRTAYLQWEKTQIEDIVDNESYVVVKKLWGAIFFAEKMNFMENKTRSTSYDASFRRNVFEICPKCALHFPDVEEF